jgi:hypothetical protein
MTFKVKLEVMGFTKQMFVPFLFYFCEGKKPKKRRAFQKM